MKLAFGLLVLFAALPQMFRAQQFCGTPIPEALWNSAFNTLVAQQQINNKTQAPLYTIPVIIHVIHGGQAVGTYPNLANAQLVSQIQTLNHDYSGTGFNNWNYPASAFSQWAATQSISATNTDALGRIKIADCQIQFCLATKDTLGNTLPEPGIDRINYVSKNWSNPSGITSYNAFKSFIDNTVKPQTIWNVKKYLNIWITDANLNAIGGLLGYATFPPLTGLQGLTSVGTASNDGFWCYSQAFGSSYFYPGGTYYSGYDKGRTATHEIGHWLGLRHVWGDGNCLTDFCNDTPPASASNFGNPGYPLKSGSCGSNAPNGEMFMNFMDYTNDPIKYMFTTDQQSRIATAMANSPYRKFLGTHNLCSVNALAANAKFTTSLQACAGSTIWLQNQSHGIPVPQFTWAASGNATFIPNANAPYYVTFSNSGIQTISLSAANGTLSSFTRTLNILPRPSLTITASSSSVCANDTIYLLADGALSYTWMPLLELSNVLTVPMPQSQTITLIGMGTGSCISQDSIALYVVDCTGITSGLSSQFSIYPNPANSYVYIQGIETLDQSGIVSIWDYNGKIRKQQVVPLTGRITLEDLPKGLYLIEYQNARLCIRKKLSIN